MAASNVLAEASDYPLASLYVGDLHPDVTEAMLYEKLSSVGNILSIRICRDMITRRPLGYAYVNFQKPDDAKRALDAMNFDLLHGRPLRIMWSQRNPELRKSGVGNVFIKYLHKSIDNKALYDAFLIFGNILSCKIMIDENGQSRGFGYVNFETQKAADNAVDRGNGMLLGDKKVYVTRFMPRNQRADVVGGSRKFTNIFIKNFGEHLDEEKLRELCSKYGKILSLKIEHDENGHSKGFGFCSFESSEEAEEVIQNLNGYSIGDKNLYVVRFQKKNERQSEIKRKKDLRHQERINKYQSVNLYIKNLDDTIDDKKLRKEFSKFGTITSAKIMLENGQSLGFGFVCFSAPDEAKKAINKMNGSIFGSKPLYVTLAQRKEERRTHLINQHMQRIATSRVPPPTQLPFPNGTSGMMSYIPTPMSLLQPQRFYLPTPFPTYQSTPGGSLATTAASMSPQTYSQMLVRARVASQASMPMPMPMLMPMPTRPIPTPGQMINSGSVRPQTNVQQQPVTYTGATRNSPQNNAGGVGSSIVVPGQEPLTLARLANATRSEQKQMLGERLFPLIQQMQPGLAGKVTGMLLEIDNIELLYMLESPRSLEAKVREVIAVLQARQTK